jgi:O-methyltransferase domain
VTGDFFAAVPEADLYLLKMVLHDWDDEQCVRILRKCRTAVRPNGRTLIVEMVIGELGWAGLRHPCGTLRPVITTRPPSRPTSPLISFRPPTSPNRHRTSQTQLPRRLARPFQHYPPALYRAHPKYVFGTDTTSASISFLSSPDRAMSLWPSDQCRHFQ